MTDSGNTIAVYIGCNGATYVSCLIVDGTLQYPWTGKPLPADARVLVGAELADYLAGKGC